MGDQRIARFEQLYREQFDFVWGTARSLGVWDAAIADVVQEVFITAFRRLDDIDPEQNARGWLYAVTRRVVHRVRRTAARTARRELALRRIGEHADDGPARDDAAVDLERLLDQLDDTQREVFVMADLLGMSGPEMAAQIGVPLDTVYSRLRLARGRLQRIARASTIERAVTHGLTPPDAAQSRRSWAALVIALPRGLGVAAWLGGLGGGKLVLAVGGTAAIAVVLGTRITEAPRAAAPTLAQNVDAPREVPAGAPAIASPPPVAAPAHEASATAPAPPRAKNPTVRTSPSDASVAAPAVAVGIDAELAALERARARLDAHDAAGALAIVEARSGDPGLADARGSLRVRALCEIGRGDEARAELGRLRAAYPDSHVLRRTSCAPE